MLEAQTTNRLLVAAATDAENSEAWSQLHAMYHAALVRHGLRSGLTAVEAEDVAVVTLTVLAGRLGRLAICPEAKSLRGWLGETANRLIFDAHRNRRRDRLSANAVRLMQQWLPAAFAPGEEPGAREKLEAHLWSVCLARVRSESSPHHWQVFEAYALQGRTSAEVARLFNLTAFNVRMIRSRVVARLRAEWRRMEGQAIELPE